MNSDRTAILILHYGAPSLTRECLASVIRSAETKGSQFILLIDNSENQDFRFNDGLMDSRVQVLRAGNNLGYAEGMNIGIQKALMWKADFIFLLNNDAIVDCDCMHKLTNFLKATPNAGIVSPLILHKSLPRKIWATGSTICHVRGLAKDPYHNKRYRAVSERASKVDSVTGCAMMVKAEVFLNVGLFDVSYFAYYEDVDFCYRAGLYGYGIYCCPSAHVYHSVAASSRSVTSLRKSPSYFMVRNRIYFTRKYSTAPHFLLFLLLLVPDTAAKLLAAGIQVNFRIIGDLLLGFYDGIFWKAPFQKRDSPEAITACIITKNAEKTIERCLASVAGVVDEIVIVDSGSTDDTIAICKKYTEHVYHTDFLGDFSKLRNMAAAHAKGPWILALDADEYLSDELRLKIKDLTCYKNIWGYYFRRINFFGDQAMRFGSQAFASFIKLYRKQGAFSYNKVHERVVTQGHATKTRFRLYHRQASNNFTFNSFHRKWMRYVEIESKERAAKVKRSRMFYMLMAPPNFAFIFLREILVLLGIMDGFNGIKAAYFRALYGYHLLLNIHRELKK